MSTQLWRSYFDNDVNHFRQVLARAAYNSSTQNARGGWTGNGGLASSPGAQLAVSPTMMYKSRKATEPSAGGSTLRQTNPKSLANVTLSRADLNWTDSNGVTLLHQIASSANDNAADFALALLENPLLDLYIQDLESGWTALHRALYFGNVTIARALMDRDARDAAEHSTPGSMHTCGGLIKIKDREGNSPFDVYGASTANRMIRQPSTIHSIGSRQEEDDEIAQGFGGEDDGPSDTSRNVVPSIQINGDEIFAFGSNKNFTLGFGDGDDRQFPERVSLKRPDHLVRRFRREYEASRPNSEDLNVSSSPDNSQALPAFVQYRPLIVQDVQLSKLHSAVLTTDPEANLYTCGFGSGGRLGTGDESTRFSFVSIHGGALLGKKIVAMGLGQDHTIVISEEGDTITWGSNAYGQLGYTSNTGSSVSKEEKPIQLLPRQVFGPLKREIISGAAASRIHGVVCTKVSLYTFGKNEGQLGLVDSDARSRTMQDTPRKVAASLFTSTINSISAIDKATICLLDSHEVWVFANYGYTRMSFPLDGFSNYFLQTVSGSVKERMPTSVIRGNEISRITSGGDTICAMSSMGDVFTVQVSQKIDSSPASSSTTNPAKIRGALSAPQRVWSLKKGHMAVRDVDMGQDGSIIICTESGSVWRRVKRAKIRDATTAGLSEYKAKDYKFSRVPRLTRVAAVRSNVFGGFAALRRDCDVLKTQVDVEANGLWKDLYPLLPLYGFGEENSDTEQPAPRFWTSHHRNDVATIRTAIISSKNIEIEVANFLSDNTTRATQSNYDVIIGTTASNIRIPVHEFVVSGRSEVMRNAFALFRKDYFFIIPEVLTIEYDKEGQVLILFQSLDLLTILNLVLYMYADSTVDVWHHTKRAPKSASKYRQVRTELIKVSSQLGMRRLEQAVRVMSEPAKTLHEDMQQAVNDTKFFDSGNVEVELDGSVVKVHSPLICQRCPFFEGLFEGRAAGRWLSSRREQSQDLQEAIKVDLKHVNPTVFTYVLKYMYADTDERMFDDTVTADLDSFLDLVLEVMAVANELMLDRLSQCCQKTLGCYVNTRNVCQLLNAVAPCSVTEFKDAALEYICLNLEGLLENNLLSELDDELMLELDAVVRQNQLNCLPISKSGRAEAELFENNPELVEKMEQSKNIRVDAVSLHSRLYERESRQGSAAKAKVDLLEDFAPASSSQKDQPRRASRNNSGHPKSPSLLAKDSPDSAANKSPVLAPSRSPMLSARKSSSDLLMFDMDDYDEGEGEFQTPKRRHRHIADSPRLPPSSANFDDESFPPIGFSQSPGAAASLVPSAKSPSSFKAGNATKPHQDRSVSSKTKPWTSSSSFIITKRDMKEIMTQTSATRILDVSSSLTPQSRLKSPSSGSLPTKLSQKERKRQQQQQQHQQASNAPLVESKMSNLSEGVQQPSPNMPHSPWQIASRGTKVNLKEVLDSGDESRPTGTKNAALRTPSPMTLRQTVSGKPAATRRNISDPVGPKSSRSTSQEVQPQRQQQSPIISKSRTALPTTSHPHPPTTPTIISSPKTNVSVAPPTAADFPPIHSIRHTPIASPAEPSLQLTMSEILAQQNREKELLKEIAAKRSLQEIQEEQAFQEWWDLESKKAREQGAVEEEEGGGGGGGGPERRRNGGGGAARRRPRVSARGGSARGKGRGGGGEGRGGGNVSGRGVGRSTGSGKGGAAVDSGSGGGVAG